MVLHSRSNKLKQAIENNNLLMLRKLVRSNVNLEKNICDRLTALEFAAQLGRSKIVNLLISFGANPNTTQNDEPPLTKAVLSGDLKTVKILVEMGANLDYQTRSDEWTALMEAIAQGHLAIAKLLVESGASLCLVNLDGHTALNIAIQNQRWKFVEFIIPFLPTYTPNQTCDRQYAEEWLEFARINQKKRLKVAACQGKNSVILKILKNTIISPKTLEEIQIECTRSGNIEGARILLDAKAELIEK
ncbi:Ankyrin [Geitlerinema sp. FC II]|nr:Ankyrin [Geitlerinema sp. FC II]